MSLDLSGLRASSFEMHRADHASHMVCFFSCRSSEASTNTLIDEAVSNLGKATIVVGHYCFAFYLCQI